MLPSVSVGGRKCCASVQSAAWQRGCTSYEPELIYKVPLAFADGRGTFLFGSGVGELRHIQHEDGRGMAFWPAVGGADFADDGHGGGEAFLVHADDEGGVAAAQEAAGAADLRYRILGRNQGIRKRVNRVCVENDRQNEF